MSIIRSGFEAQREIDHAKSHYEMPVSLDGFIETMNGDLSVGGA